MKTMQEIERRLMAEFTTETLMGNDVDISNMPNYSDDINTCMLQEQYSHWCVTTKKLLLSDTVEPYSTQGRFASLMKTSMKSYAKNRENRCNQAMKYLYDESDIQILVQQISMLAKYTHYKDAPDFDQIPREMRSKSLDPEYVSISIALYVVFTILVNPNIRIDQYNELFIKVWFDYYENWIVRDLMLKMRGNAAKQDFAGVLIS